MLVKSFTKVRRSSTVVALVFVGVLLAVGAGALTLFSLNGERIRHYGVEVVLQPDGTAVVRETIDYDFGTNDRHGIQRFFPGYRFPENAIDESEIVSDVRVRSASAPDDVELLGTYEAKIQVGHPDVEVNGRHRYVLEYRITGLVSGDKMSFDAIGTEWEVPIDVADIRVTAPYRLDDVACYRGSIGSVDPCGAPSVSGNSLTAHVEDLDEEEGVTIDATGAGTPSTPVPDAVPGDVDLTGGDDGRSYWTTVWLVLGWGALAYTVGALATLLWARRAGRDLAWAGGGVDAVFGRPGMAAAPITDREAERQVTMQFEPPRDLSPAHGGVLLFEEVKEDHQVAWLTQQALDGFIVIEDKGKRLRRTDDEELWAGAPKPLQHIFKKRKTCRLGQFDAKFGTAFGMIGIDLRKWRTESEMWDHAAEKRNRLVARVFAWLGILAVIAGAVLLFLTDDVWLYGTAAGAALLAGAGMGMTVCKEELSVRTPAGFALRQLVEGFRRFFAASEGKHAREAADRGELRLYSAWAVALGELDRWNEAMAAAALPRDTAGVADNTNMVLMSSSVHTTATPPASSGGGGGGGSSSSSYSGGGYSGGGSVGDGGGGGGGGSW